MGMGWKGVELPGELSMNDWDIKINPLFFQRGDFHSQEFSVKNYIWNVL
jgi:hypothetical protein